MANERILKINNSWTELFIIVGRYWDFKSKTTDIVLKLVQGQNSDTLRLKTHVRTSVNQKGRGEPSFLSLLYGSFYPSTAVSQLESRATCKLVVDRYISYL